MNITELVNNIISKYNLQQVKSEWISLLTYLEPIHPKLILEIGTGQGASALSLSHFTDCIITVDITKPPRAIFKEIRENCECHFINDSTENHKCIRRIDQLLNGRPVDLLFIDGGHTRKDARRDYDKLSPLVRSGGLIVFHDIVFSTRHKKMECSVYKVWQKLKPDFETIEYMATDWGGIGILKVP